MTLLYRKSMPTLDLHGEDIINTHILVNEFLNDCEKLQQYELAIIHGVGKGILKKEVHNMLKKDKRVVEFGLDIFNEGCTLVCINSKKIDKANKMCYNTQHNQRGNSNV